MKPCVALAAATLATGCGGGEPALDLPPPLGAAALPGLASRDRALPARELAQDALAPSKLAALLVAGRDLDRDTFGNLAGRLAS